MKEKVFILMLLFGVWGKGFCWGPITHYWLSQSISSDEIFCNNGMNPDLFWAGGGEDLPFFLRLYEKEWGDKAHSPRPVHIIDPKHKGYDTSDDKENFAYIMSLCSREGEDSYWKGFGAHIAGDWVAHHKDFLSLATKEENPGLKRYHTQIEFEMDWYTYLKKGKIPEPIRIKTNPLLIWRALVNKRLIELKRQNPGWSDEKLKNEAIKEIKQAFQPEYSIDPTKFIKTSIRNGVFLLNIASINARIERELKPFLTNGQIAPMVYLL